MVDLELTRGSRNPLLHPTPYTLYPIPYTPDRQSAISSTHLVLVYYRNRINFYLQHESDLTLL
jgi:hypothetical protein